jgi:hypothetical protein
MSNVRAAAIARELNKKVAKIFAPNLCHCPCSCVTTDGRCLHCKLKKVSLSISQV